MVTTTICHTNMKYINKNLGKSPFDPDYREDYNQDNDLALYEQSCEEREELKRERNERN